MYNIICNGHDFMYIDVCDKLVGYEIDYNESDKLYHLYREDINEYCDHSLDKETYIMTSDNIMEIISYIVKSTKNI